MKRSSDCLHRSGIVVDHFLNRLVQNQVRVLEVLANVLRLILALHWLALELSPLIYQVHLVFFVIWVEAESHLLFRCSGSVASEILAAASVHSSSELPRRSFLLLLLVLLLAGLFDDLKESGGLASSLFRFYGQLRRPLNHILPQHGVAEQAVLELLPRELWIRLVIHNLNNEGVALKAFGLAAVDGCVLTDHVLVGTQVARHGVDVVGGPVDDELALLRAVGAPGNLVVEHGVLAHLAGADGAAEPVELGEGHVLDDGLLLEAQRAHGELSDVSVDDLRAENQLKPVCGAGPVLDHFVRAVLRQPVHELALLAVDLVQLLQQLHLRLAPAALGEARGQSDGLVD